MAGSGNRPSRGSGGTVASGGEVAPFSMRSGVQIRKENTMRADANFAKAAGVQAPYVSSRRISLGGSATNFLSVSADPKSSWTNGIFQNSRYGQFAIRGGKVELISKGPGMPKFRKQKASSPAEAGRKIQAWLGSAG